MDEMTGMQRPETMSEDTEEHRSRGRWGIVAAVVAAAIGSLFAARRVRSARRARTPITIA